MINGESISTKHERNFASCKISAKFWWRNFAVKNFAKWKIVFRSMLCYGLWAEFRTLQNFAENLAAKFRRYEFRNTKIPVSVLTPYRHNCDLFNSRGITSDQLLLLFLDVLPRVPVALLGPLDQLSFGGLALDGVVGVEGQTEVGKVLLDSLCRVPHLLHGVAETNLVNISWRRQLAWLSADLHGWHLDLSNQRNETESSFSGMTWRSLH